MQKITDQEILNNRLQSAQKNQIKQIQNFKLTNLLN